MAQLNANIFEVIRYGDYGYRVYQVQYRLKQLGYYHEDLTNPVGAYFDEQTQQAVARYQRASGIFPADTVVNWITYCTLGLNNQDG